MLRIYPVTIELAKQVSVLAERIKQHDVDQARQLRRSVVSVVLNVAEGSGLRGGNRRLRYLTALGSAQESLANLECASAIGHLESIDPVLRERFRHVIGTLVKVS